MKNKFIYLAIIVAGLVSCEPEFNNKLEDVYTAGEADFSSYVAIGNSLTAGVMDGTVYKSSQMNSFPNLLSQQFALVGGGVFTQPSFEEDVNDLGGITGISNFNTRLVIDALEGKPENIAGTSTITLTPQKKAYNNMGVPGAKVFHLLADTYGSPAALSNANPYFIRHATTTSTSVLGDATSLKPTFFTCWIGANDILSYATGGGAIADDPTTPSVDESLSMIPASDNFGSANDNKAGYDKNDITSANVFKTAYTTIIEKLTANGAKGVVATIPSVTSLPYFTTVPYNALPAEATASNPTAIALYQFLSLATGGRISALSTASGTKNPVLINDVDLEDWSGRIQAAAAGSKNTFLEANAEALGKIYGKARHATAEDLVVLPASDVIGKINAAAPTPFNVNGVTLPLANKWVLTAKEQVKVAEATTAFNATIISIANDKKIAVADMNAILGQLVNGLKIETGQVYTANYFSGVPTEVQVLFSLDGIHPNARGYAVITNAILNVINGYYKANLPLKYVNDYPGIKIVASN